MYRYDHKKWTYIITEDHGIPLLTKYIKFSYYLRLKAVIFHATYDKSKLKSEGDALASSPPTPLLPPGWTNLNAPDIHTQF